MTNQERVFEIALILAKGRGVLDEQGGDPGFVDGHLRYVVGVAIASTEKVLGEKIQVDVEDLICLLKVAIAPREVL